jgi:tetratricopeptide (TPR) repeat protein
VEGGQQQTAPRKPWLKPNVKIAGSIATALTIITGIMAVVLNVGDLRDRYFTLRPFRPAREGEVLVIVTDFTGADGEAAATRIYRALAERVAESGLEDVRVERLEGNAPEWSEDAQDTGGRFEATLVIWGTADSAGIEPFYEVVRNRALIETRVSMGATLADLPAFNTYVVQGMPDQYEYLLLFSVGQMAYFSQQYEQAIDLFTEALAIDTGEGETDLGLDVVYFYRGFAQRQMGSAEAALADYDRAIELNPEFAAAYLNRGAAHYHLGEIEEAVADYTRAVELDPENTNAYYNRALAYQALGEPDLAIEDYSRAIDLNPQFAAAYLSRGILYRDGGEPEKAIEDYTRAIEADPEYADAYNNRGYLNAQMGVNLDEALEDIERALELDPDAAYIWDSLGYVRYRLGDYEDALEGFTHALEMDPPETYSYYGRAMTHEALGDTEAALQDYRAFLEDYPDSGEESEHARERIEALGG